MSENLGEFFSLIGKAKKEKEDEFRSLVGDLDIDSMFSQVKDSIKEDKKKKKKEEKQIKALESWLFTEAQLQEKTEEVSKSPVIGVDETEYEKWIEDDWDEEEEVTSEVVEETEEEEVEDTVDHALKILETIKSKEEVRENLEDPEILKIRRELEYLKNLVNAQGGGGEVRLEFLDDVDRDTAKVDGKFLKYDSSTGKFIGADASGGGGGGNSGITIKEEGSNVGTAGSVTSVNFVGDNITASASGAGATITLSDTPQFDSLKVTGLTTFSGSATLESTNYLQLKDNTNIIGHNGVNNLFRFTDTLQFRGDTLFFQEYDGTEYMRLSEQFGVQIKHQGSTKLQIESDGITVTGTINDHTIPSGSGTFALTSDVPTNNNELTNGAGYITTSFTNTNQLTNGAGFVTFTNNNQLTNGAGYITTSFTNTNQLTNGAGFITASDDITGTSAGLSGSPDITVGSITATSGEFSGNVTIGGTLTYEDVNSIDSVGLVTARLGINVTGGEITVGSAFSVGQAGVVTASSFVGNLTGSASSLSGVSSSFLLDYNNFTNTPTIPTNNNELTNGAGYITTSFTNTNQLTNGAGFITGVSTFSGDYNDLTNTPTIPTNNNELTNGAGYITTSFTNTNQLTNGAGFVTFTNNNQLTNGAGYITTSFTNTNQLTNGAGFITASDNITGTAAGLSGSPDIGVQNIVGVAATFTGDLTVEGTFSYEDITNVDSIGFATFRKGIEVQGAGSTTTTLNVTGVSTLGIVTSSSIFSTGIITATTFSGSLATSDLTGTITNAQLAGSIANNKLVNDSVSFGGVSVDLGASDATPAFDLSDATNYPFASLTGISTDIVGDTSPQLGGNLDLNSNDITGTGDFNVTGIITASSFVGSLTGSASSLSGVSSSFLLDYNNFTNTPTIPTNNNQLTNGAGYITTSFTNTNQLDNGAGFITASDSITGTAAGLTGTPDVAVQNITGVAATFTGNVTIGGTLTYEDVTNIDSIGIITARSDISIADKIIHTGDTDTAIRFPDADTFTVETAGSERVRVSAGGSVGIGTDNPSQKLDVNGDIRLRGAIYDSLNSTGSADQVLVSNAGAGVTWTNLTSIPVGDATTLDGLDSTQFLRSDAADTKTGITTFSDVVNVGTGITLDATSGIITATNFFGTTQGQVSYITATETLTNKTLRNPTFESGANSPEFLETRYVNATQQDFVQLYTGGSSGTYFTQGEYQKVATITPSGNNQNYTFNIRLTATSASNYQIVNFTGGLRANTLPDLDFTVNFSEEHNGVRFIEPKLWTKETTTAGFILAFEYVHNQNLYGGVNVEATIIPRSSAQRANVVFNTTQDSEQDNIDTGFTERDPTLTLSTVNGIPIFGTEFQIEGSTDNGFETTITSVDATADRTITFPDSTGTVALVGDTVENVTLHNGLITTGISTTTATDQTSIDSFSASTYRSAKYNVQVTRGSEYQTTEISVIHDGSDSYGTEYATIKTGTSLATFSTDVSGGNVRLLATPSSATSTVFKLFRTTTEV